MWRGVVREIVVVVEFENKCSKVTAPRAVDVHAFVPLDHIDGYIRWSFLKGFL